MAAFCKIFAGFLLHGIAGGPRERAWGMGEGFMISWKSDIPKPPLALHGRSGFSVYALIVLILMKNRFCHRGWKQVDSVSMMAVLKAPALLLMGSASSA